MTKYQYESGKTYLSESTPITVSRIPSGKYKINVVNGEAVGEYMLTAEPGTQKVTIVVSANDWDLSNASVSTVNGATNTISGITGSNPIVTTMVIVITEEVEKTLDVSDNNPNMIYQGSIPTSLTTVGIRLLDADGNTVAYRSDVPRTLS